jgi:hypothetical protein
VHFAIGVVQKLAQKEAGLKRKLAAAQRVADFWHERSLENVAASDTAVKHHQANATIRRLSKVAENALEKYESATTKALLCKVHMLEVCVLKQEARVELREAKLRCLRRRLRRRRLLSLCSW